MSLGGLDKEFLFALRTASDKRTVREHNVIFSRLHRFESLSNFREKHLRALCSHVRYECHDANTVLFKKDDECYCWYILMSGSVFIQGSMFFPYACFGRQIPGTKRRGCQCLVLEKSEMIAIDYPDMSIHAGVLTVRPHALRQHGGVINNSSSRSTLDSVAEADTSSSEGSPLHSARSNSLSKTANGQAVLMVDSVSQSSLSKDTDGDDFDDDDLAEEDSISLQSTSSIVIKDLVIDVLKKEPADRNGDDLEILLEFTKSLQAFSNMTEPIRRALCKVMVFAWVEKATTIVLKNNELLDSWSVIINGQVYVKQETEEVVLGMGDSFGVKPTLSQQHHKGEMRTVCDDCQFLCVAQQEYYDVLHQGQENIENIANETGDIVMVKEKREFDGGARKGNIVIRGNADSLMHHLLEDNTIDTTYTEDFLLTYRAFGNEPLKICNKLLEWFENTMFREKVIRVILLWVNNHFSDFESSWRMIGLLEKFGERLNQCNLLQETKLFNIACTAKAKPRSVSIMRPSCDDEFGFKILGGSEKNFPIYISVVIPESEAEAKGIKRGDQVLEVNGQNFEKLTIERAQAILKKNTELTLTLKTSLFAFKEMVAELTNPNHQSKKNKDDKLHPHNPRSSRVSVTLATESDVFDSKHKKGGTLGRATVKIKRMFKKENTYNEFITKHGGDSQMNADDVSLNLPGKKYSIGSSATVDSTFLLRHSSSLNASNPDLLEPIPIEPMSHAEIPEDVIKVYKADQTCRYIFVNRDTTAGDAVKFACKEFAITEGIENYALYKVSVQGEKFVKQSKLPEPLAKLADIPLGSRYYLKNTMNSEQLLPDENIGELLKEANFSFLDLNCFEVALYLTREDYKMFQSTEPTNFIEDLFGLKAELKSFKQFEDLVNRELFWVVTTLCKEANVLQRAKMLKHFTKIAHHCKLLKNLNSTFALISGLGYRAVSRMKQSWEKVPAKSSRLFEELQALMDPSRNMSKYRTLLNEYISQPPVIPYVPVVKKDLTFLHLGNDTKVEGLINFEKMRMIAKEVRSICRLCAPDRQQIVPSAVAAQQKDADRGVYQTLARRGRRSSFNNIRRMYEDQLNVRRVRQYMQQLDIITDEEILMELSKSVEPSSVPGSAQPKRRHTNASIITSFESPSRLSKTLPGGQGRNGSIGSISSSVSGGNSEPQLNSVTGSQVTRKKALSSTLPKYAIGPNSPQMISRKLMSLSEDAEERRAGKKVKDYKRSTSVSSHDLSPATSPYITTRRMSSSGSVEGKISVGSENMNKNNNRLSLPAGTVAASSSSSDPPSPGAVSAPILNKKFFPSNSNTSSSRSSIASASSIGMVSSSNPSTSSLGSNNSPRSSSPVPWSSTSSLVSNSSAQPRFIQHHRNANSPGRSSSSSSADTVKSAESRQIYHERPVIKQSRNTRSSSFAGPGMMMTNVGDRRMSQLSSSTSSPSLNHHFNPSGSHATFILPNHPQIPRTPSVDSGVVSSGSLSGDSTRFNPIDDIELFGHPYTHLHHQQVIHPVHHRLQQPRLGEPSAQLPIDRPVRPSDRPQASGVHPGSSQGYSGRLQREQTDEGQVEDKVERTFLCGSRGQGDPPRPMNKDPYPLNLPLSAASVQVDRGKFSRDGVMTYQVPSGVLSSPTVPVPTRSVFGRNTKGIQEFLVCERHAAMHNYYMRGNLNNNNSSMIPSANYLKTRRTTSPEAILEEQLVLELQKQKPTNQKVKHKNLPQEVPENTCNLVDMRRLSLSKSDPSLNMASEWAGHPDVVDPATGNQFQSPVMTSSPQSRVKTQGLPAREQVIVNRSNSIFVSSDPNECQSPIEPRTQFVVPPGNAQHTSSYAGGNFTCIPTSFPASNSSLADKNASRTRASRENLRLKLTSNNYDPNFHLGSKHAPPAFKDHYEYQIQNPGMQEQSNRRGHVTPTARGVTVEEHLMQYSTYDGPARMSKQYSDRSFYQQTNVPTDQYPPNLSNRSVPKQTHQIASTPEQWTHCQVKRKTSQEWSETDLDGDKTQQTMKAWGSSSSLSTTSLSSRNMLSPTNPCALPPRSIQPNLLHNKRVGESEAQGAKMLSAPSPPQRRSSIVRTKQLQLSSSSSSPMSPSISPTVHQDYDDTQEYSNGRYNSSQDASFNGTNSETIHNGSSRLNFSPVAVEQGVNVDRRSLPSYSQAVHQINVKQNALFPSHLSSNYRRFTGETLENKEQISQV